MERVNPIIPCRGAASALARASGFVIGVARCGLVQVTPPISTRRRDRDRFRPVLGI